jgi:hypothetical protein
MAAADPRAGTRRIVGLVAAAAALLLIIASFLSWISTPMQTGGRTTISGWGTISGGSDEVNGANLNDLMTGVGSYRPGAIALIAGVVALIPAVIISVTRPGRRPNRIVAVVLGVSGALALAWGVARTIAPGNAVGVLPAGQATVGVGPVLTAVAGLMLLAVAVVIIAGVLDPA